ncbi:MAG: class I SAM-dependent methyltransferase [Candidatus Riflebacteria bacterium]|nr:class I SAM-dependent methyltransferase [Candidatus Riflebacteria bacterium]
MAITEKMRGDVISMMQGGVSLQLAFVGIRNGLFSCLKNLGSATSEELAKVSKTDSGYITRWCQAAYAFGLLDISPDGKFLMSELGEAFLPEVDGTLMPFSVQSILSAHFLERTSELMVTGERPGEKILAERKSLLPLFGPMLEAMFVPIFEKQIFPNTKVFQKLAGKKSLVIDFGCGNGWYLRCLAAHFPQLYGIGMDGFSQNAEHAISLAEKHGFSGRLKFSCGDILNFSIVEKADIITMNRVLHHVWDDRDKVFSSLRNTLKPDGSAIIWEPNWPSTLEELRSPSKRFMASQNLAEHVQGNRFLTPEEIAAEFQKVGMKSETFYFVNGNDSFIVGTPV